LSPKKLRTGLFLTSFGLILSSLCVAFDMFYSLSVVIPPLPQYIMDMFRRGVMRSPLDSLVLLFLLLFFIFCISCCLSSFGTAFAGHLFFYGVISYFPPFSLGPLRKTATATSFFENWVRPSQIPWSRTIFFL